MTNEENRIEENKIASDFLQLGISAKISSALENCGIKNPTAVQSHVIPLILAGENVIFKSETGTGKTFAYLLPILERISSISSEEKSSSTKAVVLAPTYELSSQIKSQLQRISAVKSALLIGGAPIKRQIESLKEKPEIIIGSVGRILELLRLKKIKTDSLKFVVLDEADRLLDRELRDETSALLRLIFAEKADANIVQIAGCSATAGEKTRLAIAEMTGAKMKLESLPDEDILRKKIEHWAIFAERRDKIDTLRSLINAVSAKPPFKMIVFTSRGDQVENISRKLLFKKIKCASLYAKMGKMERKSAIDSFRSGKCSVLVTSDLAARGLDIAGVTHVAQLDFPSDLAAFTHRAGRTGRQGARGVSAVIGDEKEMRDYAAAEKKLGIIVYPKMLFGGEVVAPK